LVPAILALAAGLSGQQPTPAAAPPPSSEDCAACHNMLAMEEASPKILTDLGMSEMEMTRPAPAAPETK